MGSKGKPKDTKKQDDPLGDQGAVGPCSSEKRPTKKPQQDALPNDNTHGGDDNPPPNDSEILSHDAKSVETSDLVFPPNLRRNQEEARPGAFAQQGIHASAMNNNDENANNFINNTSFDSLDEPRSGGAEQSQRSNNNNGNSEILISATLVEDEEKGRRGAATADEQQQDYTYAEPLDKDFLNRRRISRRGIILLVLAVLALVGLSVGLTFALTSKSNPSASNEDDEDDDDALLADVNSAKDLRLMDDLRFASFHSVDYGWATTTTTNCAEQDWSDLVLSCGNSPGDDEEEEAMTTVVILGTSKPNEIVCERRDSLRNQVLCFVQESEDDDDDNERRSFSGTILAACASNDPSNTILPLQAVMERVEAFNCASLASEEQLELGGTERVVQGDSYQWISIGRFCGEDYLTNFVCEQGDGLLLPDVISASSDQSTPKQNFCQEFDTCQATKLCPAGNACQGSDQCNLITQGVQVSDPVLQCLMEQDNTNNQTFFEYNLDLFWEKSVALHDTYFNSTHPQEQRLPTLILSQQ